MSDNNCQNWAKSVRVIQSTKNLGFHTGIKRIPYEAMFGTPQRNELLDTCLVTSIVNEIETEEQLEAHLKFKKEFLGKGYIVTEKLNSEIGETELEIETELEMETELDTDTENDKNKRFVYDSIYLCHTK